MPSTTDHVFETIYQAIVTLALPPGAKVSEAEVAKEMDVSRQPVRDAFYRLSELGLLRIRPQRPTVITHISPAALHDAHFNRTALEIACLERTTQNATNDDVTRLNEIIARQEAALRADDKLSFHNHDDAFHCALAQIAGHPSAWNIIKGQKVHLDRVRYLSVASSGEAAIADHLEIVEAIKEKDTALAVATMHRHLGSIIAVLATVQAAHPHYFLAKTIS